MTILMARNVRAAIIIGISVTTIIAWLPGHGASYLGSTSNIPGENNASRTQSMYHYASIPVMRHLRILHLLAWMFPRI